MWSMTGVVGQHVFHAKARRREVAVLLRRQEPSQAKPLKRSARLDPCLRRGTRSQSCGSRASSTSTRYVSPSHLWQKV
jgi:hypothetical protein